MNRSEWRRVESIFHVALERPATAREAYVAEACAGDPALQRSVEALLEQHGADSEFLAPLVELPRGNADPSHIGPYRIIRELGAGGMGVVYLAMQEGPEFERPVALKVIRRGLDTEDVLRRFRLERRILAGLAHPNVAHLLDAGQTDDGRPYFVMQFVEGVPVNAYCEREQLSTHQRLRLILRVCDAVQHAHNNLIVHRDLKPSNILVARDGTPVLLDFGIGKLLDDHGDDSMTGTGVRAFTPDYAAPEQLRGQPVTTATDVYGLGLLLYQLLTGQRAFPRTSVHHDGATVIERDPPRPSSHGNRQLAGDLDTIILKALRAEPDRRYPSVSALADDIQRYLDGRPVRARADSLRYRAGKFARRHALALTAAAAVFVSLLGATLYSRAQARAVARERDKAIEVQTFLLEMFGSMGSGRSDSVSVRQLLDGQAALARATYGSRPELMAQMQMVIGEGYDRLGLYAPAESLVESALAARRQALPANHADIALAASLLGWIRYERGRADDGESLLRESLARWPNAKPYNAAMHARSMNDLGVVLAAQGKYDEALGLYRNAFEIRKRLFGDSNRAVGVTANNISAVLARKGDLRGAVAVAETALAIMRRVSGPDHQRSTIIQGNLASLRAQLGDLAGAEEEYRDLLPRQVRVSGAAHPVTANSQVAFASILRSRGKLGEADSLLVQALASLEKSYGREHSRVAAALSTLGLVRSEQGRWSEAQSMLERAIAIQRKLHGGPHRETARAISALGVMHGYAGRWAASEAVQREALAMMAAAVGERNVETATLRARVARAVAAQGRREEAASLYAQARADMVTAGIPLTSPQLREIDARLDSIR